jgi:hypothetical protein
MFDFIKKGVEFNKLAQSFNAIYLAMIGLSVKLERCKNNYDFFKEENKEEILILLYIAKKGVINRLDSYNWDLESKISIPAFGASRVTIGFAWSKTITKLTMMVSLLGLEKEMQEINSGGELFYSMERMFPEKLKNW